MGIKGFNVMSIGNMNLINPENVCYEDSIDIIHEELHKTRKSFIKIGWYLKHIDEKKMYIHEGYNNIVDFANDKFNLSQPTTNRFIRLCEEFSVGHNSPELDEKYANYSVSQLIEMVSMKPEQLEQVSSEMTVREIKEIKKPSKKAIEIFYNLFVQGTEYENRREGLKEYLIKNFGRSGCGGLQRGLSYECSRKGIRLNNASEITWSNLVKEINEMFPTKNPVPEEDDNIPGQTSIEKDFPEYMPEEQIIYATSHKEEEEENMVLEQKKEPVVIDGCFREISFGKIESANKKWADELIRDEMFNLERFNEMCKSYFKKAMINCNISESKCVEVLNELKLLLDMEAEL